MMYRFLILLSIVFGLNACEGFFSSTLEVDPPKHTAQLVLHTVVTDVDTVFRAAVGRSVGLLEDANPDELHLDDAMAAFYEADQKLFDLDSLVMDPLSSRLERYNFGKSIGSVFVEPGKTYTCKASHPDYGEVSATQTMPVAIPITDNVVRKDGNVNEFGQRGTKVELTFKDPVDVDNYYELALFTLDTVAGNFDFNSIHFTSLDPNLKEGFAGTYLLNDETFNGNEYKVLVDFEDFWDESHELYAIWRTVTKDYYLYSKSLYEQREAEDFGFFAEPVSIHTNVENGLGVFGMRAELIVLLGD